MWKIGPECAAQQAKCVSAMATNCGVRSACAGGHARRVRAAPGVRAGAARRQRTGGRRISSAAGTIRAVAAMPTTSIAGAPVVVRDQPARERRHDERRHAHAGRDQGHGEAAVVLEPARGHGHQRRVEGAAATPTMHAEQELELEQAGGAAGQRQADAEQQAARSARRCACRWRSLSAPQTKAEKPMARKIDASSPSRCRCATSRCRRHRLQEHRQREHRAHADAGHQHARGDDDPAVTQPTNPCHAPSARRRVRGLCLLHDRRVRDGSANRAKGRMRKGRSPRLCRWR